MTAVLAPGVPVVVGDDGEPVPGACSDVHPDVMFPEEVNPTDLPETRVRKLPAIEEAKQVCRGCDLRDVCLAGALERREPFGVWGGLSTEERTRLLKDQANARKRAQRAGRQPEALW